ncbi:MAG: BrnA antitoxin family protein [Beijerinckiaceae bacterium]
MKNERTIRVTLDEALSKPGKTDWAKFDATTEADIDRQVGDDADLQALESVDWSKAIAVDAPSKQAISIRLDQDVLDFFKSQGGGYQKRINRVLRHYVETVRRSG